MGFDNEDNKYCSECGHKNGLSVNYCVNCGHKLKKISKDDKLYRKYCPVCGEKVSKDSKFCSKYGHKVNLVRTLVVCPVCGEKVTMEKYCPNCGHDMTHNDRIRNDSKRINMNRPKKCPHCNLSHQIYFNYCTSCGTKLELR